VTVVLYFILKHVKFSHNLKTAWKYWLLITLELCYCGVHLQREHRYNKVSLWSRLVTSLLRVSKTNSVRLYQVKLYIHLIDNAYNEVIFWPL